MASTENLYVGDGSTVLYSFTFPYINTTDVKVSFNGTDTTEYSLANATTVELVSAPATGTDIRIYRETDVTSPVATFFPGSAIRAQDLNDDFVQTVYALQEVQAYVDGADAVLVKETADQALADATVALAAAADAQTSADAADLKADNALVAASSKVGLTSANGSAVIPSGSTSERDSLPEEGYLRYNTLTDEFEGYTNVGWSPVGSGGGDVEEAPIDGNQYARKDAGWSLVSGGGGVTQEYNGAAAWVSFNGAQSPVVGEEVPIDASSNVSKVVYGGVGVYTVHFTNPMPSEHYAVSGSATLSETNGALPRIVAPSRGNSCTTSSVGIYTSDDLGNYVNCAKVSLVVNAFNALPPAGGTGVDAWASTSGSATLLHSFNIASVTKSGTTGRYIYTFTTPMPDASYAVQATSNSTSQPKAGAYVYDKFTTGFSVQTFIASSGIDCAHAVSVHATNATLPFTVSQEQIEAASNNPGLSAWGMVENSVLLSGLNIATYTKQSAGLFDVVFINPMPSANYSVVATASNRVMAVEVGSQTANGFTLESKSRDTGALQDPGGAGFPVSFQVASTNALPLKGGTGTDAWASVASDGTINDSFNVASVTKTGTGVYDVVFTTPMPSVNYAPVAQPFGASSRGALISSITATGFTVNTYSTSTNNSEDSSFGFQVNATNATLPSTFTVAQFNDLVARVTALENP